MKTIKRPDKGQHLESKERDEGKSFGEQVRSRRLEHGISQQLLAEFCGISRATLINIEQGNHKVCLSTAVALANHLDMDLATLQSRDQRRVARQKIEMIRKLEAKKQALRAEIKDIMGGHY